MLPELARKRPADVVGTRTAIMPIVRHVEIVRRPSKSALLREVRGMDRRGEIGWASPVVRLSYRQGGGFAVKVGRIADPPAPMPMLDSPRAIVTNPGSPSGGNW